jgi:hypothetical protein
MMNFKELMEKERTIKGYDLVKAFWAADSYCDVHGFSGHKWDCEMLKAIVASLMEDNLYEKLHKSASESYKRATTVAEDLGELGKLVKSVISEEKEEE